MGKPSGSHPARYLSCRMDVCCSVFVGFHWLLYVLAQSVAYGPADPVRRACAFIEQIAAPMLGQRYIGRQVCGSHARERSSMAVIRCVPALERTPCSALCLQVPADVPPNLARALLAAVSPQGDASPCSATLMPNLTVLQQTRPGERLTCSRTVLTWHSMQLLRGAKRASCTQACRRSVWSSSPSGAACHQRPPFTRTIG